jgi:uncharacterized protein YfaS (alpha-2-macroglobulin family)
MQSKIKAFLLSMVAAIFLCATFFVSNASSVVQAQAIDNLTPFNDVFYGTQEYEALRFLKDSGVVQGYTDGSFGVVKDINRAEFVKMVLEAQKDQVEIKYDSAYSFPDVPSTEWFAKYVSTAKRLGIVKGYPNGNFEPARNINNVEAMKVVVERFKIEAASTGETYRSSAVEQGTWYTPYLTTVNSTNVFPVPYGFQAADQINRGETAEVIYKALALKKMTSPVFYQPYLNLGDQNGLLTTNLKSPYRLPVYYVGVPEPLHIKIYQPSLENFLEARSSAKNYYWNRYVVPEGLKSQMKLFKEFTAEIVPGPSEPICEGCYPSYYRQQKGYLELPVDAKGLYFLEVEGKFIAPRHLFLDVTDHVMLSRQGKSDNLVWLVNEADGKPVEGARVTFYNLPQQAYDFQDRDDFQVSQAPSYKKILETSTDANGLLNKKAAEVNYIVAEKDGNLTLLGTYAGNSFENPYQNFVYTDRPIYRPGDTVNFKAIIRRNDGGNYSVPAGQQVKMVVSNYAQGSMSRIFEKNYTISSYGAIEGSFDLASGAPTGNYSISLEFAAGSDELTSGSFQVEAYKKDEYEIVVNTDKDQYVNGDVVQVRASANYFSGTPVTNQNVKYTIYRQNLWNPPCIEVCALYSRYSYFPYNPKVKVKEGTGTLDGSGQFQFSFQSGLDTTEDYYQDPQTMDALYSIEISSIDESNITVNSSKNITVHAAEFQLTTRQITPLAEINKPYQVEIQAQNHQNTPYPGATLGIKIKEQTYARTPDGTSYDYWLEKSYPAYRYDYKESVVFDKSGLKTDQNGKYVLSFTPAKTANYTVEIIGTDSRSNTVKTNHFFYTSTNDGYFRSGYDPGIFIQTDKEYYEEGQSAKVNVTASVDNSFVLLTTAKDDIVNARIVKLSGKTFSYDLPLTSESTPNITLYADTLNSSRDFVAAQKELKVYARSKKLNVAVTPDKTKTLPEDTVAFTLTAKDQNGQPVQADLSFALVDKAIFKLLNLSTDDIHFAFYQPKYHYLNYAATPKTHIEARDQRYKTGGGGLLEDTASSITTAPGIARDEEEQSSNSGSFTEGSMIERSNFLDTAYWRGSVQTDATGKATLSVKLPHNLTTWVGTAIAHTKDTKVGSGSQEIVTTKDLIVTPFVPRFVTEGDSMTLRAQARNNNVDASEFTLTLSGTGFNGSNLSQPVTIAKGQSKVLEFPIQITGEGTLSLTFKLAQKTGLQNDTVTLSLPINPYGREKVTAQSGEDNATIKIASTSGNIQDIHAVKLSLAPTLADNLVQSIEYLVGYPYGCVEQIMSSFLPNVVVYQNRTKLNFKNTSIFGELDKQVASGLQRLYAHQHSDGGWGWWENDASMPKNTAYVMYGLTLAKNAGFQVNDNVYIKGLAALKAFLTTSDGDRNEKYAPYILYVLSLAEGKESFQQSGYFKIFDQYKPNDTTVKTINLAYLALAAHHSGDSIKAKEYVVALKSRATLQGDFAYFDEKVLDYEMMSSDTLTSAIALEAFAHIDVSNDIIPKLIRYFNRNNQGYYHETHSTAHAVIALVSYVTHTLEVNPDYTYTVALNGVNLQSGKLDGFKEIEIPVSSLKAGENTLILSKSGNGKLYYSFLQREFIPKDAGIGFSNGFSIERSYKDKTGATITGPVKAGDIVRVDLKVSSAASSFYTMITDRLPAGFEPVNPNLAKDSCYGGGTPIPYYEDAQIVPGDYPPPDSTTCNYYQGDYTDHRDLLDDRTVLFRTNLEAGEHSFSYFARAVTPGTFKVNPATVEMTYAPEVNGGTAGRTVVVEK